MTEARNSIELLEESKNENLQLKETIDRLRLDLDELRAQARIHAENSAASNGNKAGGSALSRSTSGTESIPPTLSRNLGRELARRFAGDGHHDEGIDGKEERKESDEAEDGYEEEEIVTTRRRLVSPVDSSSLATSSHETKLTNAYGGLIETTNCEKERVNSNGNRQPAISVNSGISVSRSMRCSDTSIAA